MGNAMDYQESGEGTRQWYNPLHRTPSLNNNSHKNSPLAFRAFTTGLLATQHSQQCISLDLKPGAVVVLEIPYVGFPGPLKPIRTEAALSSGWLPRMEM